MPPTRPPLGSAPTAGRYARHRTSVLLGLFCHVTVWMLYIKNYSEILRPEGELRGPRLTGAQVARGVPSPGGQRLDAWTTAGPGVLRGQSSPENPVAWRAGRSERASGSRSRCAHSIRPAPPTANFVVHTAASFVHVNTSFLFLLQSGSPHIWTGGAAAAAAAVECVMWQCALMFRS